MLLVGLTGGIGSGKSTVAWLLAAKGAEVIDADECVRRLQEPGTPVWSKIVEHFGEDILLEDKAIDRKRLAALVFSDPQRLALLNEITHPAVMREIAATLEVLRTTDEIVVLDVPLLIEAGGAEMVDALVVVAAREETQVERLGRDRGMDPDDVRARIRAQAPIETKRAVADWVITNDGAVEELESQVNRLWDVLLAKRAEKKRG